MKNLLTIVPAALIAISTLSACLPFSENHPTNFYTLPPATQHSESSSDVLPIVAFGRISVPSYIDTPQIVTRNGNTVHLDENNHWAEPLLRTIQRELPSRTTELLRGKSTNFPGKINVIIERLDGTLSGNVTLVAKIIIFGDKNDPKSAYSFTSSATVKSPDYSAYADAISETIDALAADIAKKISQQKI